jgi:hypothetical protein
VIPLHSTDSLEKRNQNVTGVTPCVFVDRYECYGGMLPLSFTLKMEAADSLNMVPISQTACVAVVLTALLTRIWEMLSLNLVWDAGCTD